MNKFITILVVEDEDTQRELIADIFIDAGYQVYQSDCAEKAIEILKDNKINIDIVFSDWKLPSKTGSELLLYVRNFPGDLGFIMSTAYGSITHAVEAIHQGADDYLSKPYQRDELLLTVEKVCQKHRLQTEIKDLRQEINERNRLVDMIGHSKSMQVLYRRIEKMADTSVTVLINGESGTGKELVARALHKLSARKDKSFIALNCAAIAESIAEAELFGAEKGAYTGAHQKKIGKFEAADGGTLFLDEIGELSMEIQAKLLRLLQEGTFMRVGSTLEQRADVRIVAATNRDLSQDVQDGKFREDLYYRLNVLSISTPPLRERKEDIPELISYFSETVCRRHQLPVPKFPKAVMTSMMKYHWQGNVRELSNTVECLILLADDGIVSAEDLAFQQVTQNVSLTGFKLPAAGLSWESHECDCLSQAVQLCNGNRAQAARLLQLPYKAFLYRLEKYEL